MFPRTEQRIVVLKSILLLLHCLFTFPVAQKDHFWKLPKEQLKQSSAAMQSRLLIGCNSVLRSKKTIH